MDFKFLCDRSLKTFSHTCSTFWCLCMYLYVSILVQRKKKLKWWLFNFCFYNHIVVDSKYNSSCLCVCNINFTFPLIFRNNIVLLKGIVRLKLNSSNHVVKCLTTANKKQTGCCIVHCSENWEQNAVFRFCRGINCNTTNNVSIG